MATKASESIIENKEFDKFPEIYDSHCALLGSTKLDSDVCLEPIETDVESLEIITIIVPKSAKSNYMFNPVFSRWNHRQMQRRFQIIESDENS